MSDDNNDGFSVPDSSSTSLMPDSDFSGDNPSPLIFDFYREQSAQYFRQDTNGLGPAYLVGYSVFELNNVAPMLDPEDVDLEILIASLAGSLTRGQRAKLAILLGKLVSIFEGRVSSTLSSSTDVTPPSSMIENTSTEEHTTPGFPPRDPVHQRTTESLSALSITLPTTPAIFRSRFMEGKFAILPNLPHPSIRMVDDHEYVSLKEIVADFLARATPHKEVDSSFTGSNVSRVGESNRALSIHAKAASLSPSKTQQWFFSLMSGRMISRSSRQIRVSERENPCGSKPLPSFLHME
jgi:hypothetical protein